MKNFFLIFLIGFVFKSNAQNKEALFNKTCNQMVTYLAKGQLEKINTYIQSNVGVYYIYRIGAIDAIQYKKHMTEEPFPQYSEARVISDNVDKPDDALLKQIQTKLFTQKNKNAKYDCIKEKWSSNGIFTNININKTNRLTTIINIRKVDEVEYKKLSKQKNIQKIESSARKITITKYNLVLYLYYDNKKWWLGIIDDTEADCSA